MLEISYNYYYCYDPQVFFFPDEGIQAMDGFFKNGCTNLRNKRF